MKEKVKSKNDFKTTIFTLLFVTPFIMGIIYPIVFLNIDLKDKIYFIFLNIFVNFIVWQTLMFSSKYFKNTKHSNFSFYGILICVKIFSDFVFYNLMNINFTYYFKWDDYLSSPIELFPILLFPLIMFSISYLLDFSRSFKIKNFILVLLCWGLAIRMAFISSSIELLFFLKIIFSEYCLVLTCLIIYNCFFSKGKIVYHYKNRNFILMQMIFSTLLINPFYLFYIYRGTPIEKLNLKKLNYKEQLKYDEIEDKSKDYYKFKDLSNYYLVMTKDDDGKKKIIAIEKEKNK